MLIHFDLALNDSRRAPDKTSSQSRGGKDHEEYARWGFDNMSGAVGNHRTVARLWIFLLYSKYLLLLYLEHDVTPHSFFANIVFHEFCAYAWKIAKQSLQHNKKASEVRRRFQPIPTG